MLPLDFSKLQFVQFDTEFRGAKELEGLKI